MNRLDLSDWLRAHGCVIDVAHQRDTRVLVFINQQNGKRAYLDSPIDETPVKAYTACAICSRLGIEIPSFAQYCEELDQHISEKHLKKNKRDQY